jgi:hypothetical protein
LEDLDIGQASRVIYADMHELPSRGTATVTVAVSESRRVVLGTCESVACSTDDPPELLDIDVQQISRARAFVAHSRLKTKPAELAHPDSGQDP